LLCLTETYILYDATINCKPYKLLLADQFWRRRQRPVPGPFFLHRDRSEALVVEI